MKRWIAKLLGIKPERPVTHISIPEGAVLIMPSSASGSGC